MKKNNCKPDYFHENIVFQSEDIVKCIVKYLRQNYRNSVTLDNLCKCFFISKYYMCRIFKEEMGVSIIECLNRLRLEQSLKLLSNTEKSITDVSEYVGFNDCSYYIRLFKLKYHITPNNYRSKIRLNE